MDFGHLTIERYPDVAKQIVEQFPNVSKVAIALRESLSVSHNNWGAMLYDGARATQQAYFALMAELSIQSRSCRIVTSKPLCEFLNSQRLPIGSHL